MYYMRDVLYFTILYNFRLYLGRNVPGRTIIPRRRYLGLIDKYFWGFRDSYLKPDTINESRNKNGYKLPRFEFKIARSKVLIQILQN